MAHNWKATTFHSPTSCQQCDSLLWGLTKQGVVCSECKFIAHEKCTSSVPPCSSPLKKKVSIETVEKQTTVEQTSQSELPKRPPIDRSITLNLGTDFKGRVHEWQIENFKKPTYCSVCTKFIWGLAKQGYRCSICSAAAHPDCKKESLADCRPSAPVPTEMGAKAFGKHHFVRVNLRMGSKCCFCSQGFHKSSGDGFRCSGCGKKVHLKCFEDRDESFPMDCQATHSELLYMPSESCAQLEKVDSSEGMSSPEHPISSLIKTTPLIAFINSRSGGGQGTKVYQKLRKLLSPSQVFDLAEGGPRTGLLNYREVEGLKILCCGGDGTCCWVLSVLDEMGWESPYPPIAVLPLGTGNDLSRALGWGPGYADDPLSPILKRIPKASIVSLDRWKVWHLPVAINEENPPTDLSEEVSAHPLTTSFTMNNYWSIGVDATVALDFHRRREENPGLFKSRAINKGLYGIYGMKEMVGHEPIRRHCRLYLDDEEIALSEKLEGIIVLNIQSYAGGCDLWGKMRKDSTFHQPSMSDGLLEVVGIKGTFHMAKIQTGGTAKKIGQAHSVAVQFTTPMATQVDGEPKEQEPGMVLIRQHQSGTMMSNEQPNQRRGSGPLIEEKVIRIEESPARSLSPPPKAEQNKNLIAFINSRSGGGQGTKVYHKLRKLLSPSQVFDLAEGGPRPGLLNYREVEGLKILCCGGDGTCCWVLSVLDEMEWESPYPPIAVLPLGTGNDLSRALGWGPGYGEEPLSPILNNVSRGIPLKLDRWKVWHLPVAINEENPLTDLSEEVSAHPLTTSITMNNYWSIGVDATVALSFHRKREENPGLFKSRAINKGLYGIYGMKEMVGHEPIRRHCRLYLDDEEIALPENLEGIIVLNIQSYAGGCDLWGKTRKESGYRRPTMSDGLLEVVGIKGTFHMAKIQTGGTAKKIGQAHSVAVQFTTPMATQVDGEPKEQETGTVLIRQHQSGTLLLNRKTTKRTQSGNYVIERSTIGAAGEGDFIGSPQMSSPQMSSPQMSSPVFEPSSSGEPLQMKVEEES